MKKVNLKEARGITLVALVITVIILLILAGVALSLVIGENGLITKSKQGVRVYKQSAENETEQLASFEQEFGSIMGEPKIPKGFKHTEGTVEEGYVIQDEKNGNEFVWVPVDINDFKLEAWKGETLSEDTFHEDTNNATYKAMLENVKKNGGFYVGRYELGIEGGTLTTSNVWDGSWTGGQAVIRADVEPYNYMSQTKAREVSRDLYRGQSYLLYGVQWDAIMKWLEYSGYDVASDSSSWGNCWDSEFEFTGWYVDFSGEVLNGTQLNWKNATTKMTKAKKQEILMKTGVGGERNRAKNIYNLAGNLEEWTQERYGTSNVVRRGGSFELGDSPAVLRSITWPDNSNYSFGARVGLSVDLNSVDDLN